MDAFEDQLRVLSLLSLPVYQTKVKSGGEHSLRWWLGFLFFAIWEQIKGPLFGKCLCP